MKRLVFLALIFGIGVTGCGNPKTPNSSNFKIAINKHLKAHGKACVGGFHQFPVDIVRSQAAWQRQDLDRMAAFESAGVVKSSDVMATPENSMTHEPVPVKRFELTESGTKALQQRAGFLGGSFPELCYADESVDSIVKWNEPMTQGGFSMTVVTYTYRLNDVADWARNDRISSLYPEIKREFDGEKTQEKTIALQLTNKGWDTN